MSTSTDYLFPQYTPYYNTVPHPIFNASTYYHISVIMAELLHRLQLPPPPGRANKLCRDDRIRVYRYGNSPLNRLDVRHSK